MEWASKAASRIANGEAVTNVLLMGAFVAMSARSVSQQREIEALEAQRESLIKTNKSLRNTMWSWKQQLFAEASSIPKPPVPLSKLKSIYGEAELTTLPSVGDGGNGDGKSPAPRIMI